MATIQDGAQVACIAAHSATRSAAYQSRPDRLGGKVVSRVFYPLSRSRARDRSASPRVCFAGGDAPSCPRSLRIAEAVRAVVPRVPVSEKCNMAMVASNMSGHIQKQLTRSLERILEEAHLSGELKLSGRKLKDFPKVGKAGAAKYNLQDTVIAGESI